MLEHIMSVMGAGYAMGQEFLQYFIGYGYMGITGLIIITLFFIWYGITFIDIDYKIKASSQVDVLKYLCVNAWNNLQI